jgi:predicted nuclease of predicted toxin-antitoxin system
MKLFAELYLDEDVSVFIATLLQARGFKATTARDEGKLSQDDPDQLAHAASIGHCLVTHNRVHFEQLHEEYLAGGNQHFGIIIAARRSPFEVARRLAVLLNTLTADELQNQLFYI